MNKFTVAHVYKSLGIGGTEKHIEALIKYQRDSFDFNLFLFNDLGIRGERLESAGIEITVVNEPRELIEYDKFTQADVLHIHGSNELGVETIGVGRNANIPVIIKTTHFGLESDGKYSQYVDKYIHISRMTLLRELRLRKIPRRTTAWKDKYSVLYNPIDFNDVESNSRGFRSELDIPENTTVLGKIGRSAPEKWGYITITAFERVLQSKDFHLLLVNAPDKIRGEIKSRGLRNNVSYINNIPLGEESRFYNTIDILAHSSLMGETCGYVMLEAMAHRVPVIVNSTPMRDNGQIEVIKHNERGLIANTTEEYAKAINKLVRNKQIRRKFGNNGRRYVEKNHNIADIIKRLERLYIEELKSERDIHQIDEYNSAGHYDMEKFEKVYTNRLRESYDNSGVAYLIEMYLWQIISLYPPTYREQVYRKTRGLIQIIRNKHTF